jgi:hypothetical protein
MLWLALIVKSTEFLRSVVNFTEFGENLIAKPLGALLFSLTVSLPLDAAGRGLRVRLE